jgi:hypothetical protein
MKKQLINEAFRLQQLAGVKPVNSLNENTPGFDAFMDAVDDTFEPGTLENKKLADAVSNALDNGELEVNQYGVDDAYGQVEKIAKELGLMNEKSHNEPKSELEEGDTSYGANLARANDENVEKIIATLSPLVQNDLKSLHSKVLSSMKNMENADSFSTRDIATAIGSMLYNIMG